MKIEQIESAKVFPNANGNAAHNVETTVKTDKGMAVVNCALPRDVLKQIETLILEHLNK